MARSALSVGIRDLKMQAPDLVNRAARGERIIITRYGKPLAELQPVSEEPIEEELSPQAQAWQAERKAFERMLPRLMRRYEGQYVAVFGGKVVDADRDPGDLYKRVWESTGVFIGKVGEPDVIDMPGFETT